MNVFKHMKFINFSSSLAYRGIACYGLLRNALLATYKRGWQRRKNQSEKFFSWSFEETAGIEIWKQPFSSLLAMKEGKILFSNAACRTFLCLYIKPSGICKWLNIIEFCNYKNGFIWSYQGNSAEFCRARAQTNLSLLISLFFLQSLVLLEIMERWEGCEMDENRVAWDLLISKWGIEKVKAENSLTDQQN